MPSLARTSWKLAAQVFSFALALAMIFTLVSVGVAISTADKCGRLDNAKEWAYFPPHWECAAN